MKKTVTLILLLALLAASVFSLSSCGNMDVFDTQYTYSSAMIKLPDGTSITVDVLSWTDYSDSDMVQIKTTDGMIYFTHSTNVVLMAQD